MKAVGEQYLAALEHADLNAILDLFAANATIKSPVYGIQSPESFYKVLFGDTRRSKIETHHIFLDGQSNSLALHFTYHWTLSNGDHLVFEVVDILKLDTSGQITSLNIIYDSSESNKKVKTLHDNK